MRAAGTGDSSSSACMSLSTRAGESRAGEDNGHSRTDNRQPIVTCQVTSLQVALGYQKSQNVAGSLAFMQGGPAGSVPDLGRSASAVGGAQGSFSLPAGCLGVEKRQMQLDESKSPSAACPLVPVCPTAAPTRPGTTQFRPTGPGERKEEWQRAQGQMSEFLFPRVPLIMLVRKRKRVQTFAFTLFCISTQSLFPCLSQKRFPTWKIAGW